MLTRFLRGHAALTCAGVICLAACAGCGVVHTPTKLGPARRVVVAIDREPSALYAPIYEGIADGTFASGALAVSVMPSGGGAQALRALSDGRATLAVTSEPALLQARADGAHLVAIAALESGPLESIISLANHPVTRPAQLVGKTVATTGTPLASAALRSFLAPAAITDSQVRTIDAGADVASPLLTRKALASVGGLWNYDAVALALAGRRPHVIRLTAAGVPTFSDLVVVARVGEAHYGGAVLRAFLQSLTRSERAVRANPAGVAKLLVSLNPSLSRRFELAVLAASATEPQSAQVYGYQPPTAWAAFAKWMNAHGLLGSPTPGGLAITDEFLPGQGE